MQKLVGETTMDLSNAEKQFQLGLAKVGLLEVNVSQCFPVLLWRSLRLKIIRKLPFDHQIFVVSSASFIYRLT